MEQQRVSDNDPTISAIIHKIENIRNTQARNKLFQVTDYIHLKNKNITPEFLQGVKSVRKDGAKLADVALLGHQKWSRS